MKKLWKHSNFLLIQKVLIVFAFVTIKTQFKSLKKKSYIYPQSLPLVDVVVM